MFIYRFFKNLVLLILVAAATIYVANYKVGEKTVQEHVTEAYRSGLISEGVKDIKTWIGDVFKTGQKVAKDNITDKDKAALEEVIKNELKDNVTKLKEEATKKAEELQNTKEKK